MPADTAPAWPAVPALPECPEHRRLFDDEVRRFANGCALRRIASALDMAHRMAPEHGSYGKMMAIYSNECMKATAREAAAWAAGAAAGRSAAGECLDSFERNASTLVDPLYAEGYREACEHIRALPLPPMPATTQGGNADE